ncbi:MAG: nucleotidyltransferase domain-containing protein [Sandaracinus sp.]
MDRDALVRTLAAALARTHVRLAVLFGSRARGTGSAASDVDLAVLAPGDLDRIALSVRLERESGVPVDVTSLEEAPYALLLEVLRDGVLVFEREPGAHARWTSRTLCELETDLPNLRRMQRGFTARVAREGLGG